MAAETLNFGPEWLRALSGAGGVASPPPSPALPPRSRLAAQRYGREEMLALYVPGDEAPREIREREFAAIAQEEPLPPLALLPLTPEEQRNFSLSVNSVAVLRLMGRAGGGPPPAAPRGRPGARSRGRGRAEGGFPPPRGPEEAEGFARGREVPRSQSWEERGERRFEKPPRREGGRAPFEEGGGAPRKEPPRSDCTNWRSLRGEPGAEEGAPGAGGGNPAAGGSGGGSWRLGPPPPPVLSPPPPRPLRDPPGRDGERWRGGSPEPPRWRRRGGGPGGARGGPDEGRDLPEWCLEEEEEEGGGSGTGTFDASGAFLPGEKPPPAPRPEDPEAAPSENGPPEPPEGPPPAPPEDPPEEPPPPPPAAPEPPLAAAEDAPPPPPGDPGVRAPPPPTDTEDEEGMKHLQQEAEKLVASLQEASLEEEGGAWGGARGPPPPPPALPLAHRAARKWFYRDPQGHVQGPFAAQEMAEWFQAGYLPMALLVKRGCDEAFQPLGDVIKMWGRVPFAPGPAPPPLLGNLAQERLKKQQELAAAALYQQLQHQQFLQLLGRQPLAPCPVPPKAGELTPQQLGALLQQLQALKPRQGEPNLLRSLSLPEAMSLWDPLQPPGSDSGLWELPLGSPPPSPILEQLQLQQKLQELRARREEDDQRKRRQEEELLRRKQCRQQEALLKLLQQSGVPGGAPQNWALPKVPPPAPDSERPPPKAQRGAPRAVGVPWGAELWPPPEKSPPAWEESGAGGAGLRGGGGGKGGRGGPPPGPGGRGPEEALLKLLRGLPRPPEPLPHWCQAALQALGAPPVPGVETPPQPPSPFEAWPHPGDPAEAQPFPRPLLEHRGPQEAWLGAGPLPLPLFGPGAKPPPPEGPGGGRGKQRPLLLLHSDPSILGYSLHGPGGEVETVEEY